MCTLLIFIYICVISIDLAHKSSLYLFKKEKKKTLFALRRFPENVKRKNSCVLLLLSHWPLHMSINCKGSWRPRCLATAAATMLWWVLMPVRSCVQVTEARSLRIVWTLFPHSGVWTSLKQAPRIHLVCRAVEINPSPYYKPGKHHVCEFSEYRVEIWKRSKIKTKIIVLDVVTHHTLRPSSQNSVKMWMISDFNLEFGRGSARKRSFMALVLFRSRGNAILDRRTESSVTPPATPLN